MLTEKEVDNLLKPKKIDKTITKILTKVVNTVLLVFIAFEMIRHALQTPPVNNPELYASASTAAIIVACLIVYNVLRKPIRNQIQPMVTLFRSFIEAILISLVRFIKS